MIKIQCIGCFKTRTRKHFDRFGSKDAFHDRTINCNDMILSLKPNFQHFLSITQHWNNSKEQS